MRILITGACGFVGSTIVRVWREHYPDDVVIGVDNLSRAGAERNRRMLSAWGAHFVHADVRAASDVDAFPDVDWILDAAALPSVLGGITRGTTSRQLIEHNLLATINLLELCKRSGAGLVLLSTSRVYSIAPLRELSFVVRDHAFHFDEDARRVAGVSCKGLSESFPTSAPVSLYGATKLACEQLALEYGEAFGFPVWINRCGVMAGAGQFGRPDQGIFAFWLNAWLRNRPLTYVGFGGDGHQVRDCLHPADLVPLLARQMAHGAASNKPRVVNVSGGATSAMSLRQLSDWCARRWGPREVRSEPATRPYDVPWLILDSSLATAEWEWQPRVGLEEVLEEIAVHAEMNPDWLEVSNGG